MTLFKLAIANLRAQAMTSVMNVVLLALGTASIAILLIASAQLAATLSKNAAGIDLVVGAKGSPLQLVLAGVYHADVPPGNIPLEATEPWSNHPMVAQSIPLSLGDSYGGFRIVGSNTDFLSLYDAPVAEGRLWERPYEAIIGANVARETGLEVNQLFAGTHGLSEQGQTHEDVPYKVVGLIAESNSTLDNLIVTSLESVWMMHGHAGHEDHDEHEGHDEHEDHDEHEGHEEHDDHAGHVDSNEITLLLIKMASPLGALSLPREINETSQLQAASPAFEIARLLQIVGIGRNWLNAFAGILVVSAALSIFAALYASLRARRHSLAVLRCLGASRFELFYLLLVEGLILTTLGVLLGMGLAHSGIELVGQWLGHASGLSLTGWVWAPSEGILMIGLVLAGALMAMVPAWQAYQTDVATTLSTP